MKKNESVEKVLTRDVITAQVDQKVSDVRKLLATCSFHHMPVVSGKKLIGLISASDMLGISVEGLDSDQRSMDAYLDHQFTVEQLMNKDLRTLPLDSTIADAADVLSDGSFHAVPILDENGDLAGIVTSTDLIRFLRDLF